MTHSLFIFVHKAINKAFVSAEAYLKLLFPHYDFPLVVFHTINIMGKV